MFNLFATPEWFNQLDILYGIISLVIALLITSYSWKVYKLSSDRRFAYFSIAFALVSFAYLCKLITYGNVYFHPVRTITGDILHPLAHQGGETARNLFYRAGFFLQMTSMLGAWLLVFLISQKSRDRLKQFHEMSQIVLFIYLVTLIGLISTFNYAVFFLTSLILLALIVLNYYRNFLNTGKKNAYLVMSSFFLIMFAQLLFIFVQYWDALYFVGQTLMLVAFLIILGVYRKVTKK